MRYLQKRFCIGFPDWTVWFSEGNSRLHSRYNRFASGVWYKGGLNFIGGCLDKNKLLLHLNNLFLCKIVPFKINFFIQNLKTNKICFFTRNFTIYQITNYFFLYQLPKHDPGTLYSQDPQLQDFTSHSPGQTSHQQYP